MNPFRALGQTYEGQNKLSPSRCDLGTARSDWFTQGKIKRYYTYLLSFWNFSMSLGRGGIPVQGLPLWGADLSHNLWYHVECH